MCQGRSTHSAPPYRGIGWSDSSETKCSAPFIAALVQRDARVPLERQTETTDTDKHRTLAACTRRQLCEARKHSCTLRGRRETASLPDVPPRACCTCFR
ncbi:hypothetical protein IscW_ISCW018387, partial [Ixodes scapularis]